MRENLILQTDAYKLTHWLHYPKGTRNVYSYFESRGGEGDHTVFFGLQYLIKRHLEGVRITQEDIDGAEKFSERVFGTKSYFNRAGWEHILTEHGGRLPVRIRAVPEGTVVSKRNVLMTVENTDQKVPWLTNVLETLLVRVWYPTTVCTLSYEIRRLIQKWCEHTGCEISPFHLNDFGYRGVSSEESAAIGGLAHLVNFQGTDTLAAIKCADDYYGASGFVGGSVMAAEHSTITSHGMQNEGEAYLQIIDAADPNLPVSIVSDSYNIEEALDLFGLQLKEAVLSRPGKLVVRPDSGNPPDQAVLCLRRLWEHFGGTENEMGFRVLDPRVGVIYGDGINTKSIGEICKAVFEAGYAMSNIIFGMGGGLLQQLDRDTHKFAFKCSAVRIDGEWRDVWKNPVTDTGKHSKPGRLRLARTEKGFNTEPFVEGGEDVLEDVFVNGDLLRKHTLDEVRETVNAGS